MLKFDFHTKEGLRQDIDRNLNLLTLRGQVILKDNTRGEVQGLSMKFSDYSEVKCSQANKVKTPELETFLQVPWEVPKLRKKIAHRKNLKNLVNIQGSDSGISMSSQETKDILSMRPTSQVYLPADRDKSTPGLAPSAQAEDCATVEDDSQSEESLADCKYSSYPRRSINANNEFHFQPPAAGHNNNNHNTACHDN